MATQKTRDTADASISFPKLECWNPAKDVATIAATVDKERVLCHISLKTLISRFGASKNSPMRSVSENRVEIQAAAKKLIKKRDYEEDGSVIVRDRDL